MQIQYHTGNDQGLTPKIQFYYCLFSLQSFQADRLLSPAFFCCF